MRVGVVGLGFMGSTHLQAYEKIEGVVLAAVVSSDERKLGGDLRAVGGNLSVPGRLLDFGTARRYRTPEALFSDPDVDAVDLCVPTDLHLPLVEQALRAGKHVLVEKPMALNPTECRRLLATAAETGRVLMVAQVLRFWPEYVEARRLAVDGTLGDLRAVHLRRRCAAPAWGAWLQEKARSGGGAFDLLIHDFDYAIHLLGAPTEVVARGLDDPAHHLDQLDARVEFRGGVSAQVSGGWFSDAYPFGMEFTLSGTEGVVDFHSDHRPLTLYPRGREPQVCAVGQVDPFEGELRAFIEACRQGEPCSLCPPQESADAVSLTLGALESRASGGGVVRF